MQNLSKNFNEFSSTCVDNSAKNQEKSVKNQPFDGGMTENASKTPKNAHISGDFDKNSTKNQQNIGVDGKNGENKQFFKENTANDLKNNAQASQMQEKSNNGGENQSNTVKSSESQLNGDNSNANQLNGNKDGENQSFLTFEEQIERDFKDFETIYPNVSKNSLLSDENLRIFAEGKENKQFSVIYAKYIRVAQNIAEQAILQEKARKANADSASGSLSSSQGAKSSYFTREQVKAMSPSEIKKNYELIRQSQQNW